MQNSKIISIILYCIIIILILIIIQYTWLIIEKKFHFDSVDVDIDDMTNFYEDYVNVVKRNATHRKQQKNKIDERIKHRNRANTYYEHTYKLDPENTHDTFVVHDTSQKYQRLLELIGEYYIENDMKSEQVEKLFNDTYDSIRNYINVKLHEKNSEEYDINLINKTLEYIMDNNIPIYKFNNNYLRDILLLSWLRANIIDNDDIKLHIIKLLEELSKYDIDKKTGEVITKHGNICTQGIATRIISSFILLDKDEIMALPIKDASSYKNEAYDKSLIVLNELLKNPDYVKLFNKFDLEYEEIKKYNEFVDTFRQTLKKELIKDYESLLPENKLKELIEECQQGVDYY